MEMLLVKVETSSGVVGWGEAFPLIVGPVVKCALETVIAPLVIGKSEDDYQALIADLRRKLLLVSRGGPIAFAIAGLDIALWDIAGKKAGKSISQLLGGAGRTTLTGYASLMKYPNAEVLAVNCRRALSMGYKAIKIHDHRGTEHTTVARETIGDDIHLMIDVNCSWSLEQALGYLPRFEELKLNMLEEPLWPPENIHDLCILKSKTKIPIASGENASSGCALVNFAASKAVDFVQPSVIKIGGILEILGMVKPIAATPAKILLHTAYFGPGLLATLHLASFLPEESWIEDYFCELPANPMGDVARAKNGRFIVPTGPGLGKDPDPLVIREYQEK
jgi:L-alanine-DL-glutamate epimerase-like enolase superfamily enzyme